MPIMSKHTFEGRVLVEPISPIYWRLHEEIRILGEKETFVVPAGFVTDFATVPRIAVWLIARFGLWTLPAIFHDWLLTARVRQGLVSSVDADALFRRTMRELKVPPYRRNLMWTGVRWAALFNKSRRPGWLSTAPEMMLYTIIFLLSVIPPLAMIVVALALVVHGAFEFVASAFSKKDEVTTGSLST
jgi:hypothetical protein